MDTISGGTLTKAFERSFLVAGVARGGCSRSRAPVSDIPILGMRMMGPEFTIDPPPPTSFSNLELGDFGCIAGSCKPDARGSLYGAIVRPQTSQMIEALKHSVGKKWDSFPDHVLSVCNVTGWLHVKCPACVHGPAVQQRQHKLPVLV